MDAEVERCLVRHCDPVDGAWTAWSRERLTDMGLGCAYHDITYVMCLRWRQFLFPSKCYKRAKFPFPFRWSKCSATCGAGRVERRRACADPG